MFTRLVKEAFEDLLEEFDNEETQKNVKERVLDPLIHYVMDKMYPYMLVTGTIAALLMIMLITILYVMLFRNTKNT